MLSVIKIREEKPRTIFWGLDILAKGFVVMHTFKHSGDRQTDL